MSKAGNKKYKKMTEHIVSVIVEKLEAIQANPKEHEDWKMPWHSINFMPSNAKTGKPYAGSNFFYFAMLSDINNQEGNENEIQWNNWWATSKQWESLGRKINKNEEAAYGKRIVTFMPKPDPDEEDSEEIEEPQKVGYKRFMSTFKVFNYAQTTPVEGAKKAWEPPEIDEDSLLKPDERVPAIDKWVSKTLAAAKISLFESTDGRAYYKEPSTICIPPFAHFSSPENYYSTLFHEMTHATACQPSPIAPHGRIIRESTTKYHTDKKMRALEELTAELGSVFLSHSAGITPQPHSARTVDLSVKYIASWIEYIKSDPDAITKATSQARESLGVLQEFAKEASVKIKLGDEDLLAEFATTPSEKSLTQGIDPRRSIRKDNIIPMQEYLYAVEEYVMEYYQNDEDVKERFDATVPAWIEALETIREAGDMHIPRRKNMWIQENNLENLPPNIWYSPRGERGLTYRMPEDIGFPYTASDFVIPEWGDEPDDDAIWHFGNIVFAGLMNALSIDTHIESPV